MRILFAGTPAVAVPALAALLASTHDVVAVLTRPPAPVGRKRILTPSPVHQYAEQAGLPVITGRPHAPQTVAAIEAVKPDVAAVVAYGALLREPALSMLPHGWINLHFSVLPAWRGAAPVQRAIMAGDTSTGATTFAIEAGLDTGPTYASLTEPIGPRDTAADLLERLASRGSQLLVDTIDQIEAGTARCVPQPSVGISLAPPIRTSEAGIDWRQAAHVVDATIRGLTPAPGAWTTRDSARYKVGPVILLPDGQTLRPGEVAVDGTGVVIGTGTTAVRATTVAPPGKGWMAAADWARGARWQPGWTFDTAQENDD